MKPREIRKPDGLTRAEWIAALAAQYPQACVWMFDANGGELVPGGMPYLHITYRERDDYAYGDPRPRYVEWVEDTVRLVWEPMHPLTAESLAIIEGVFASAATPPADHEGGTP